MNRKPENSASQTTVVATSCTLVAAVICVVTWFLWNRRKNRDKEVHNALRDISTEGHDLLWARWKGKESVIMIIIMIIVIIIITIITITITIIVSLKIWEVFLQFCILLPYRHLYKKEEYRSECSSHHVSHSSYLWGRSWPELSWRDSGQARRKFYQKAIVHGFRSGSITTDKIFGNYRRRQSSKINSSQHSFNTPFFILHLINFLED